jgi:transmembrane sensor
MTVTEQQIRRAIAEQAAEWFVASRTGPLDEQGRTDFMAWLRTSPLHVAEYLGVASIARDLAAATSDPDVSVDALLAQTLADEQVVSFKPPRPRHEPPTKRAWVWRGWAVATSATCALLVGLIIWSVRDGELLGLSKTYRTAHGEQSSVRLPDGTVVHLNTDSAVTVRYGRKERVVDVDQGEALFQVAHADGRRFRVVAGVAQVLDVATEFDVFRQTSATVVTVVEGEVAVLEAKGSPPLGAAVPADAQRVRAGYQLRIDAGEASAQPMPVNVSQALAWLHHKIVFEQRPLGEVAEEFNRYARIPVVIEDATLRALPISGVVDAYDTDSFMTFLATLEGVRVLRTATQIRVVKTTPK